MNQSIQNILKTMSVFMYAQINVTLSHCEDSPRNAGFCNRILHCEDFTRN